MDGPEASQRRRQLLLLLLLLLLVVLILIVLSWAARSGQAEEEGRAKGLQPVGG